MRKITKIEGFQNENKRKVAAYCRVSTASEEQLLSLKVQKAHYEDYIKSNPKWEFAGVFYDEGISGTKKEKRDGLKALLKLAMEGNVEHVITKSISRFSRSTTDCLEIVRELLTMNVTVYFEKENIDTGAMESELMLTILTSLAEQESVSISKNAKWSIKKQFEQGTFIIKTPPYGYRNEAGKMVIVPEEAAIVRRMFDGVLEGKGTTEIADELNAEGLRGQRGGIWYGITVNKIIHNEKYMGDALFQKTFTDDYFNRHVNQGEENMYLCKNHHEAIVSEDEFNRACELIDINRQQKGIEKGGETYTKRYAFSGKVICGECGSKFKRRRQYKKNESYVVWSCKKHLENKNACSVKAIKDEALKVAFVTMMNKLRFARKIMLKPLLEALGRIDDNTQVFEIVKIEQALEENEQNQKTLINLSVNNIITMDFFNKKQGELLQEAEQLNEKKRSIVNSANENAEKEEALSRLLKAVTSKEWEGTYSDEFFNEHVDSIVVISREEVIFNLKCGLKLKEKVVQ